MTHRLEFLSTHQLDLQLRGKPRLEQLLIKKGEVLEANVRPYVCEGADGPMEVADLELPYDGTLLTVPMSSFRFLD